jgi:hypothetical protein
MLTSGENEISISDWSNGVYYASIEKLNGKKVRITLMKN